MDSSRRPRRRLAPRTGHPIRRPVRHRRQRRRHVSAPEWIATHSNMRGIQAKTCSLTRWRGTTDRNSLRMRARRRVFDNGRDAGPQTVFTMDDSSGGLVREVLLERLWQGGIGFQGAADLDAARQSHEQNEHRPRNAIKAGKDTFNNMMWNQPGPVQHERLDSYLQRPQLQRHR